MQTRFGDIGGGEGKIGRGRRGGGTGIIGGNGRSGIGRGRGKETRSNLSTNVLEFAFTFETAAGNERGGKTSGGTRLRHSRREFQ
jgi:hypothetical protein